MMHSYPKSNDLWDYTYAVLILVVMDDALVHSLLGEGELVDLRS